MAKVVLISCVSKKLGQRAKAEDLYVSNLFRLNMKYAKSLLPDHIFILSAKHGVLGLYEEIEPYDETLNKMSVDRIKAWAGMVVRQLSGKVDLQRDHFIILAGEKYRKYLIPHLRSFEIPLQGLTIGKQLHYLKNNS